MMISAHVRLIGLAAAVFALANGRVAGISGLLGSLLQPGAQGRGEAALFLLGLLVAPLLWGLFAALPMIEFDGGGLGLIGAGLLFGLGWGIAGVCPGPALAILLSGHWQAPLFVAAMLAGMLIFAALEG